MRSYQIEIVATMFNKKPWRRTPIDWLPVTLTTFFRSQQLTRRRSWSWATCTVCSSTQQNRMFISFCIVLVPVSHQWDSKNSRMFLQRTSMYHHHGLPTSFLYQSGQTCKGSRNLSQEISGFWASSLMSLWVHKLWNISAHSDYREEWCRIVHVNCAFGSTCYLRQLIVREIARDDEMVFFRCNLYALTTLWYVDDESNVVGWVDAVGLFYLGGVSNFHGPLLCAQVQPLARAVRSQ